MTENPKVCTEYDELHNEVSILKDNLKTLYRTKETLIEQVKDDIETVNKASAIGEQCEYFRQRIRDADTTLIKTESSIKDSEKKLKEGRENLERLADEARSQGMKLISKGFFCPFEWITNEVYEREYKNKQYCDILV